MKNIAKFVLIVGLAPVCAWSAEMEEIVVTAMKREQNLQDVAASISAVSGEELKDRGIANVQDLSKTIPNLNWGEHFGTTMISIRGVGSIVDSGITEPTVAMYVDGIFLPRSTMSTIRAIDVDRIEVLRGPQGTLYGRNATGGAINFVSQGPSAEFEGQIDLTAKDRSGYGVSGYVSGPISDTVSFRLSASAEEQDGFVDNLFNGEELNGVDSRYVRGVLRFEPSDDLQLDLALRRETSDAFNAIQQQLTLSFLPVPGQTDEPNELYADQPMNQETETTVGSVTVDWAINDDLNLKSITSYVDHESHADVDADATHLDGFNTVDFSRPSESWAQEFTLSGTSGELSWLAGLYYFNEEASNTLPLRLGAGFAPGFGVPTGSKIIQGVESETTSIAVYMDLNYSLSEKLELNIGLRYARDEQDFEQLSQLELAGIATFPLLPDFALGAIDVDESSSEFLPKIGISYFVSDNSTVYANWSRGYKSGGLNLEGGSGLSVGEAGLYEPEELDAFEFGFKTQNDSVTLSAAAFYYDYSDLQVTITVPPTTTLVQNSDAEIYGLEAELTWQPNDNWEVYAATALTHGRFDGFEGFDDANPTAGVQDLDGEQLPQSPDVTANLGVTFRTRFDDFYFSNLMVRGDVRYSDDFVIRYFGGDVNSQESFWLSSLSVVLSDDSENTMIRIFGNNLGDEEYLQQITYIGAIGSYMGNYGPPRTWGVTVTRWF